MLVLMGDLMLIWLVLFLERCLVSRPSPVTGARTESWLRCMTGH